LTPPHDTSVPTLIPTLTWTANNEAIYYTVQLNVTSGWELIGQWQTPDATPSFTVPVVLSLGVEYTWQVDAFDSSGHWVGTTSNAFDFTTYTLQDDTTPPVLMDLSFIPTTIDVGAGDQNVTVTLRITDDLAGVSFAEVRFRSPSDGQYRSATFNEADRTSGDMKDGIYEKTVTFPQYSETGNWYIEYVYLVDTLTNTRFLNTAEIIGLGFNTLLTVEIK